MTHRSVKLLYGKAKQCILVSLMMFALSAYTEKALSSSISSKRILHNPSFYMANTHNAPWQPAISGIVSSSDQTAVFGVSVVVKGTSRGTTTDEGGKYSITASQGEILVFSYLGYITQEIVVGEQSTINVALEDDTESLDEVVVIGYGTQRRKEVTSAVATVRAENFNAGGARSPMDLIQGKVAGLNITRTQGNNPNSSAAIQLRGVTSITGGTSPLIVIDGIPGGSLNLLQQDDVESFDVLKDGSAAAIYGTRGNAGVILITTKKGRGGDPVYEYSTYLQREAVDRKPEFLSASEFRQLISEGIINESEDFGASTDLYDELIDRSNFSQYHNFAASGGSEKTNYRASIFFNDANGIAKQSGREQFGGRININQQGLQDRLRLQVNLASNFSKSDLLGGGYNATDRVTTGADFEQAIQRNPTAPIYNGDGSFFETQAYNNYNPMSRLANRISERNQQDFSGDAKLTLDIIEGLSVSAFGSYVRDNYNERYYRSVNDWDQREQSDFQGMAYASKFNLLNWLQTFESTIDYNTSFGDDHTLTALAGYSYQYGSEETFNVNNNGFTNDGFLDWNLGAGSAINNTGLPRPGMGSNKFDNTLIAFFGRANYAYRDRYFIQAILRREGSSRFGANNKWGNFPAASAGWTLSEENFLADVSQVDNLKLRVGYGVTGNQGIPNYRSLLTLGDGGVYPQEGVYYQTYGPSRNANPDLRWEKKAEWNFGVDFGFFGNRLTGAIDVYNRTTTDLLYDYTVQQPAFIRDRMMVNVGSIQNHGVEILLSGIAIRRDDFEWSIDLTGNSQNNKLTKLSSDLFQVNWIEYYGLPSPGNLGNAIRLEEGGAVGNFYGKRYAGLTDDGKWLFYKADGSTGTAAEMNDNDLAIIGNGVPKYNASLGNNFKYKNFDLTIFLRGKFGFDILNTQDLYFGNKKWLPNNLLRSAITTHDQLDDDPQYSDYYIEKGDFVKIDNITLGYSFDLNTAYIKNMRLYVSGRNIATITGYTGLDPELQDTGFEPGVETRGFYPRTRSWTMGLNVSF